MLENIIFGLPLMKENGHNTHIACKSVTPMFWFSKQTRHEVGKVYAVIQHGYAGCIYSYVLFVKTSLSMK